MKMGKEFYELIDMGNNTHIPALKMMVADSLEELAEDYPYNGYKYNRAIAAANKFKEDAKHLRGR